MTQSNNYPMMTGWNSSPAGDDMGLYSRQNTSRFSTLMNGIYHWTKKKLPTAGASDKAFDSLGLVEFTQAGCGAGVRARQFLNVFQPPQLYVGNQGATQTGFGGLAAGQIIFQPLYDPNTNTYGGNPV